MNQYYVEATSLYDASWHPAPPGYAARSVIIACNLDGRLQCACVSSPRMQLAAARAIVAADRERAARSRENYERRIRAQQARAEAW